MKLKLTTLALSAALTTGMAYALPATKDAPAKPAEKPKAAAKLLKVGDQAPALKDITWLQGEAVKSLNEKGKVYIVECWATWCGPCIAIIPHMNDLHKEYADKGLVVVGMNVFEEGADKAKEFIKSQGDEMSYRVAYSGGKAGDFATSWLKAAKVNGIPTAFVVKDGKIIYIGHPYALEAKAVESMMSDDFSIEKFEQERKELAAKKDAFGKKVNKLFMAKDWAAIKQLGYNDEMVKGTVQGASLIGRANKMQKDWAAQITLLKEIQDGKHGKNIKPTQLIGGSLVAVESSPEVVAFAKVIAPLYKDEPPQAKNFFGRVTHARTLFLIGDNAGATKALEGVKTDVSKLKGQRGVDEFLNKIDLTLEALKEGKFPPFR